MAKGKPVKGNKPVANATPGLTDQHKKALTAAGIDWAKFISKVQNALPYLIALATIFLSDGPPVMQSAKKGCTLKEALECALHQQICATHTLCAALCECEHNHDDSEE